MTEPVYELHPKMLLDSALKYAQRGFRVLPLHSIRNNACTCGNAVCKSAGKHPLTLHGANDATLDQTRIRGYWSEHPFANIGIAMGDNDIVALDVDTRNNGHLSLEALIQQHGQFPDTAVQRTGNGWHYLFRVDPMTLANVRGILAQGIDIKANGYIVAEPSIHHSGRRYAWDEGLDVLQGFIPARAPVWLERLMVDTVGERTASAPNLPTFTLPKQLVEAADALSHLDANDYHQWIEAGMALHATGLGDAAYQVWVEWSQESSKFDHKIQRSKWMSFGRGKSAVTIKTLFSRAQAEGWVNPMSISKTAAPTVTPTSAQFTVETGNEFARRFKPPQYVIDGLLLRGYLHGLTGLSNAGKTAIGLSMAGCVALGRAFGQHKTEKAKVLFLAGENPEDIRLRVRGMQKAWFLPDGFADLTFAFARFDLDANMSHLEALAEQHGGFGLVVVDSSAAFFAGQDENSNTDMVMHAIKLRRLTELAGRPAVMVLCHPSKYASGHDALMPRGGSAFLNELDANLTAFKDGEVVQLGWNKVRGPAFDFIDMKLEVHVHDGIKTNLGSAVTSIVATAVDARTTDQLQRQLEADENMLLRVMFDEPKLSLRDYAERLGWLTKTGQPYVGKVQRLFKDLEKEKLVRRYRKRFVLTAAGKKAKDEG